MRLTTVHIKNTSFHFYELPRPVLKSQRFKITTERGEVAPRLAAMTEKRANKNVKIRLLF